MPIHYVTAIVLKIRVTSELKSLLQRKIKKNTILEHHLHRKESYFSGFFCDNESPDMRNSQAGLSDRIIY
jgi:hypothetical protein